jgi:predicted Rossmann-fold nucleotide-binding protein
MMNAEPTAENTGTAGGTDHPRQPETPGVTLTVIAVFGGAEDEPTLKAARQIGHQISLNHAILLTGGDDPNAGDLKAHVLAGALAAREGGAKAPWIGVVRETPTQAADGLSLVLTPGVNHRRNYVEADLCHAAIAFEGGDGTSSEVVFCFALGKPLVLVGRDWLSKYPAISTDRARDMLRDAARRRVPLPDADDHQRLGPQIRKAYETFDRGVDVAFKHCARPPETSANAVVEAAVILATEANRRPVESLDSVTDYEREALRQFYASCRLA